MKVKVKSWVFSSKPDRMYEESIEIYTNVKRVESTTHAEDPGSSVTLIFNDGREETILTYETLEIEEEDEANKNHGCGTTFDDLIDMADNIDMSRKEEASKYLNNLLEKKESKGRIILNSSLLLRDKSYRKALKTVIKKHKLKVNTVWLSAKEDNIIVIYNKKLNCLAINENTSIQDVKTALNRLGEMDYLPRDEDYEYVLGRK